MSGGAYEYRCHVVLALAEDIRADAHKYSKPRKTEYGEREDAYPKEIIDAYLRCAVALEKAGKMAHDVEWFQSGDYGDESFLECVAEWGKEGDIPACLTRYTVRFSRNSKSHGSDNADLTICGKEITSSWIIIDNDHSGFISCAKCIKLLGMEK